MYPVCFYPTTQPYAREERKLEAYLTLSLFSFGMTGYSFYLKCSKNSNVNSRIRLWLRHVLKSKIRSRLCCLVQAKRRGTTEQINLCHST